MASANFKQILELVRLDNVDNARRVFLLLETLKDHKVANRLLGLDEIIVFILTFGRNLQR